MGNLNLFWECLWFLWVEASLGLFEYALWCDKRQSRGIPLSLLSSPPSCSGLKACFAGKLLLLILSTQSSSWVSEMSIYHQGKTVYISLHISYSSWAKTQNLLDPHPNLLDSFWCFFLKIILQCSIQWQTVLSLQPLVCFHIISFLQGQEGKDDGTQTWLKLIPWTFLTKTLVR